MLALIIILAIVLIVVLWGVSAYNKLVKGNLTCDEAFSTMDVYMKKRFDLIPNLVSTVKGYAKHESETLENVVKMRNSGVSQTTEERMQDENQITGALRQIFALSENYPNLKANSNFQALMAQLEKVEEDIANSRKFYNAVVNRFNLLILAVPTNIIAGMFKFVKREMFEVDSKEERQNVKVEF